MIDLVGKAGAIKGVSTVTFDKLYDFGVHTYNLLIAAGEASTSTNGIAFKTEGEKISVMTEGGEFMESPLGLTITKLFMRGGVFLRDLESDDSVRAAKKLLTQVLYIFGGKVDFGTTTSVSTIVDAFETSRAVVFKQLQGHLSLNDMQNEHISSAFNVNHGQMVLSSLISSSEEDRLKGQLNDFMSKESSKMALDAVKDRDFRTLSDDKSLEYIIRNVELRNLFIEWKELKIEEANEAANSLIGATKKLFSRSKSVSYTTYWAEFKAEYKEMESETLNVKATEKRLRQLLIERSKEFRFIGYEKGLADFTVWWKAQLEDYDRKKALEKPEVEEQGPDSN